VSKPSTLKVLAAYANARLTVNGKALLVDGSSLAPAPLMSPTRWAAHRPPPTSGCVGSAQKGLRRRRPPEPTPPLPALHPVGHRATDPQGASRPPPRRRPDRRRARGGGPDGGAGDRPPPHAPAADLDALTGAPVRRGPVTRVRYERERPGELTHDDVKKLRRIPDGGGSRAHGRGPKPVARRAQGYDYVHSAVDHHSRLTYSEVHRDDRGATCAGSWLAPPPSSPATASSWVRRALQGAYDGSVG
jgi:hypothetical protein